MFQKETGCAQGNKQEMIVLHLRGMRQRMYQAQPTETAQVPVHSAVGPPSEAPITCLSSSAVMSRSVSLLSDIFFRG